MRRKDPKHERGSIQTLSLRLALLLFAALAGCDSDADDRCCPIGGTCDGFSIGGTRVNGSCRVYMDIGPGDVHKVGVDENGCAIAIEFHGSCYGRAADTGTRADTATETNEASADTSSDAADEGDAEDSASD